MVGAWLYASTYTGEKTEQVARQPASEQKDSITSQRVVPPGFKEYRNQLYHVSLLIPQGAIVSERKEAGTAMTAVFTDEEGRSFQIFIVPYGEKQVTRERFMMDVPSGVMASSTITTLSGVKANVFYSKHAAIGDTYEIWTIHHGFLYEITTYKEYDSWLNQMVQTWSFL